MVIAENTLFSPMSKVKKVRFGGWKVKVIRDDAVVFTPTVLSTYLNTTMFFSVRDQDNVPRILSNFVVDGAGVGTFSADLIDTSKDFKFDANTGFWTFSFPPQTDGWVPGDSPLGFKLIMIPRFGGLLAFDTNETQMAKKGNGGPSQRNVVAGDFGNQDNLLKQGTFTVKMPVWKVNFATQPNPARIESLMVLTENPTFQTADRVMSGEGTKDISINHEMRYRCDVPGLRRDNTDMIETFGDGQTFGIEGQFSDPLQGVGAEMRFVHGPSSGSAIITKITNIAPGDQGDPFGMHFQDVGNPLQMNWTSYDFEGNASGGGGGDIFSSFARPKNFDEPLGVVTPPF